MNWPNWMKDNVLQWLIGSIFIPIIVAIVWALWPSPPPQGPSINGDYNVQVTNSPGATVIQNIKNEIDPEELSRQIIDHINKKHQEVVEELKKDTPKDKRAEEALIAFKAGNYEKARVLFETLRKEEKEREKEYAETAYNLGNVYFVELNFSKALEVYLDAVRLAPDNSTYLNEVGKSFYTLAQYEKAIEYYEKALKSNLKTFGEDHPMVAIRWNNLGLAWNAKGEYDKAIEYYERR